MSNATRDSGQRVNFAEPAAPAEFRDFGLYGLRVRSAIDLGEWPAPPPGDPQVSIILEQPTSATVAGEPYSGRAIFSENECHIEVRGVARYVAIAGSCIRVAPEPGAKPEDVRQYLTGATFGAILHQRGTYVLHASCVMIDDIGVAFSAPSGNGKSTLTAALLRRGATFVSDDICVFTPVESGRFRVWRGAPRLKLDPASVAEVDDPSAVYGPAGGDRGKLHVPVASQPTRSTTAPLSRVYLLSFGEGAPRLERLSGLEAISALLDETYILAYAATMGFSPQIFKSVAELARTIVVSRLIRPRGFEHMDAVLNLIERDVRTAPQPVSPLL